jgi:hypothetical protein
MKTERSSPMVHTNRIFFMLPRACSGMYVYLLLPPYLNKSISRITLKSNTLNLTNFIKKGNNNIYDSKQVHFENIFYNVLPPFTKECNSHISRSQTVSTLTKIIQKILTLLRQNKYH